ncbi:hypothetical protein [Rhizobium halophytocola]|uniref:Lipoprotein n=1 Tax=Rhizobium halophytocola TaxID=735519 RepID=A0ABS4DVX2_9HYPH|nr:hypothetical protein [Rhizobium halophytocola]MBP1849840.1 hypothetical protein [Rhizobium halophytocola]
MKMKIITASTLALVCLTTVGCVSEGGSYVVQDSGPRYYHVDRGDRDRGRPDRDRHDQRYDRRSDGRRGHEGWRDKDGREGWNGDRARRSRHENVQNGRWIIRDGRRIWVPERR